MRKKLAVILRLIGLTFIRILPIKSRILYDIVIVRTDKIGDFVLFLDALAAYRHQWRDKKIMLICNKAVRDIAFKSNLVNEVLQYDSHRMDCDYFFYIKFMLRMKRLRAGMVINPVLSHHVEADEVCAVIQSKYKVGTKINRLSLRGKWCDSYFDRLIEIPINNTTNEIKAITSFTKELVDDSYSYKLSDLSFIYKNYTGVIDGKYCLISLSASVKSRIWPISKVIDVLKKIPISYKIVLTGYGADDKSMAETIINSDSIRHKYVNMVNQTSLIDLICLVSKSSFVLGNDSAIVHIAAACRVPSICYTPGAHFNRFVPYPQDIPEENFHPRCVYFLMECYNCDYYCKYVHKSDDILPCLLNISSEMVINEMSKLLLEIE